jgi:hypothetical protein
MRTISFSTTILSAGETTAQVINDFVKSEVSRIRSVVGDEGLVVRFDLRISKNGSGAVGRNLSHTIYKALIAEAEVKIWADAKNQAVFRFDDDVFVWKNKEIYFTMGEKCMLVRSLLLKYDFVGAGRTAARAMVRRLREKFGPEFPGLVK